MLVLGEACPKIKMLRRTVMMGMPRSPGNRREWLSGFDIMTLDDFESESKWEAGQRGPPRAARSQKRPCILLSLSIILDEFFYPSAKSSAKFSKHDIHIML